MTARLHARPTVRALVTTATVGLLGLATLVPSATAAEPVPASLSDVRASKEAVTATVVLRGEEALVVDAESMKATIGGQPAAITAQPAAQQPRTTMLVIDTSGSMEASGMATVRSAVREFLAALPKDVKVGVVSFADTSGVDVPPTTDRAKIQREVASLESDGETALYAGVQDAVTALGAKGERSIVLLSDGGDTVSDIEGGRAREAAQRKAALDALSKAKVRAEVVAFKSPEGNSRVLQQFAKVGGGSVASAGDQAAVSRAFAAAARTLASQAVLQISRPADVTGRQQVVVSGSASGRPFRANAAVNLGDTAPIADPKTEATQVPAAIAPVRAVGATPVFLYAAMGLIALGLFVLSAAVVAPAFRSRRSERVSAIERYGFVPPPNKSQHASPSAIGEHLIQMGDRVMENRESTTKTLALLDRADLPWRAGEWFVLRIVSVVVGVAVGVLLFGSNKLIGAVLGAILGFVLPPLALKYLARRRARQFESVLPDVLMLVATSLASGFSLLQALDSVSKDAPSPANKEFSRALAESRIGADVGDALEHMSARMDSDNMRWTTMAIRIQRDVGGNLAETLRTTAATLREREMLRRQVRGLSAEGRLSAYILIALPVGLLLYSTMVNYDYVSLLWTTLLGALMSVAGIIALVIGIFWMRKVVKIEV